MSSSSRKRRGGSHNRLLLEDAVKDQKRHKKSRRAEYCAPALFQEVPLVTVHEDSHDHSHDHTSCGTAATLVTLAPAKPHIGVKEEATSYMVTNRWILNGYRVNYDSWKETLKSLFQVHNETVNVWTHLVGFLVCLVAFLIMTFAKVVSDPLSLRENAKSLLILAQQQDVPELPSMDFGYIESQRAEFNVFLATMEQLLRADQIESGEVERSYFFDYKRAEAVNTWPLIAYLITAMFCLGCSTVCHLCYVKSPRISKIVSNLDYWGIAILFLGSSYPFISYKYACGPYIFWRYTFMCIITLLTVACMVLTVKSAFVKPVPRAILFTAFGASVLIPTVGLVYWQDPRYTLEPKLMPFSYMLLAYVTGMAVYIARVPERFSKSGRFDIIGQSHQIFHCLVLLGVAITFYDSYQVYLDRLAFTCPEHDT